jgi:YidC/Oxa1 family membrane protein insertase
MEKRFIVFIVLTFAILIGWQIMMSKFYPEPKPGTEIAGQQTPGATSTGSQTGSGQSAGQGDATASATGGAATSTPPTGTTGPNGEATTPPASSNPPRQITVETKLWRAKFDSQGAVLKSLSILALPSGRDLLNNDYGPLELVSQEGLRKVGAPLRLNANQNADLNKKLNESNYKISNDGDNIKVNDNETKDLVFTYQDSNGLQVEKRLRFYGGQYLFDITVNATLNGQPLATGLLIGPNFGDQSMSGKQIDSYINTPPQSVINHNSGKVTFMAGSDFQHRNAPPDKQKDIADGVNWVASADHYFAMAVVPPAALPKAAVYDESFKDMVEGKEVTKDLLSIEIPVANSQTYQIYTGPKDRQILQEVNARFNGRADLEEIINYGMFSVIIRPLVPILELALKSFYKITRNYGWSIVLVTLLINLLFFPLKWKSSVAMKKTAKMQPKMKELQEKMKKYKKDDPRMLELQQEQMKLMKEGNPLSGCLPLFLQMPIFWAIYIYLTVSIDVRHSPFIFWVHDLAAPDHTRILPIVMTVSMMASTALTPTPTSDDPNQKMQKMMTSYLMPIIFFFLFLKMPAGLVLYYMFSNIIGVGQQLIINKMTTEPPNPPNPPGPTGPNKSKSDKSDKSDKTDKESKTDKVDALLSQPRTQSAS